MHPVSYSFFSIFQYLSYLICLMLWHLKFPTHHTVLPHLDILPCLAVISIYVTSAFPWFYKFISFPRVFIPAVFSFSILQLSSLTSYFSTFFFSFSFFPPFQIMYLFNSYLSSLKIFLYGTEIFSHSSFVLPVSSFIV